MTSVSAFVNQPTAARATSCEVERELLIQLPDAPASVERVALSPLDLLSMGRAVPMVWFYEQTLDVDALLAALRRALVAYPLLCGRYAERDDDPDALY